MERKEKQYGADFMEHLAILFIALKLCGVIDWSWWIVLCPLWIGGAIFLILSVIILILTKRQIRF